MRNTLKKISQKKKRSSILVLGIVIFFILNSCGTSNIKLIEVEYLPAYLNTPTPLDCKMILNYKTDVLSVSKTKINDTNFLREFEKKYNELNDATSADTLQMDARLHLFIHFKNSKIDTLCTGEYFGLYKNNVKQTNNTGIIDLVKKKIEYYDNE